MVKQAVVLADSSVYSPTKKVLGMSLLERSILTAHKGGIEKVVVLFKEDTKLARKTILMLEKSHAIQRKELALEFRFAGQKGSVLKKSGKESHFLLVNGLAIFDHNLVAQLRELSLTAATSAVVVDEKLNSPAQHDQALLVKMNSRQKVVSEIGPSLKKHNGLFAGLSVHPLKNFAMVVAASADRWQSLSAKDLRALFPVGTVALSVDDSFALPLYDVAVLRLAEKRLLNSMRKATDGFVSRNFNRYVSLFLSRRFLWLGLSPNFISFANLFLGVVAAVMIGMGKGWALTFAAAAIFQFTSIVDGCDGEVAKLGFRDSDKGAWIDTFCDQIGYLVFFIGLPVGLYRANMYASKSNPSMAWLYAGMGVLTVLSIVVMYFLMTRYVRRMSSGGSMLKIIQDIEAAGARPGLEGIINRLVFKASFIFRRDFFAFAVFVLCGLNLSFAIMWILAVLSLAQAVYLFLFSRIQFARLAEK